MHRGTGLRQALEGLSMCGTGLTTELWYGQVITYMCGLWYCRLCNNYLCCTLIKSKLTVIFDRKPTNHDSPKGDQSWAWIKLDKA